MNLSFPAQAILGDGFGEGYVAACLAALAFDTNAVVSRLLDGRPPPEVAHLSPQLADVALAKPRTLRAAAPPPDAAFAAQQKARARRLERDANEAEELRLLAGGLYDDDYDDRYDGPDDPIVAATALGDQDAVRRANRVARADEAEDAYWAGQRNLNHAAPAFAPAAAAAEDPAPAPAPDAKKVAIQRKRNNKNKSAVANHHRKDRALKKAMY